MTVKTNKLTKIALFGMDGRTTKTMILFLHGSCRGLAHVVANDSDADVRMFDGDTLLSKELLKNQDIIVPTIIFSVQDGWLGSFLYLKKPVTANTFLQALEKIKPASDSQPAANAEPEQARRHELPPDEGVRVAGAANEPTALTSFVYKKTNSRRIASTRQRCVWMKRATMTTSVKLRRSMSTIPANLRTPLMTPMIITKAFFRQRSRNARRTIKSCC
jgi:hypothetical protein